MRVPALLRRGAWASVVGFVALGAVSCGGKSIPGNASSTDAGAGGSSTDAAGSSTDAGTGGSSTDAGTGGATGGCGAGLALCSGACVDLSHDRLDCGQCDHACGAAQKCVAGNCECPQGLSDCGGACVYLQGDSQNCGACGVVCTGGTACVGGVCSSYG